MSPGLSGGIGLSLAGFAGVRRFLGGGLMLFYLILLFSLLNIGQT